MLKNLPKHYYHPFYLNRLKKAHRLFMDGHGYLLAQSLSFQTIFCIIPALATMLAIIGAMQIIHIPTEQIQSFLAGQLLPKTLAQTILLQLQQAVENAQSAAVFSGLIFLATSYFLIGNLQTIYLILSKSEDKIHLHVSILNYLLFLVLFIVALFLGSGFLLMIIDQHYNIWVAKIASYLLLSLLIYCFYYLLSPIVISKRSTMLVSALVALSFSLAQALFALYISWFPAYMLVYGTIAFLPLSLLWIYCCWMICIYGYCIVVANRTPYKLLTSNIP